MTDWIIGGLIAAITILIIIRAVRKIRRGKCGCECTGCGMADKCKDYGSRP